ncbi:MAG: lysostaphin resistance A-like protein [Candidatus Hermodarchaeota archaeon]
MVVDYEIEPIISSSSFKNPKHEMRYVIILLIITSLINIFSYLLIQKGPTEITTYEFGDISWYWIYWGILCIIPVLIFLLLRKSTLKTVGIQFKGLITSLLFATFFIFLSIWGLGIFYWFLILPALFIPFLYVKFPKFQEFMESKKVEQFTSLFGSLYFKITIFVISIVGISICILSGGTIGTGEPALSYSGLYGFLAIFAVGFGEELVFRGLLQFRAIDWLGKTRGILLSSGMFALFHFPMLVFSMIYNDMPPVVVSLFLIFLFVGSIPDGYITYKSQNLTGAVLMHTYMDLGLRLP